MRRGDEVMVLGDLSLGRGAETNEILNRLKGKIYLIEVEQKRSWGETEEQK